MLVRIINPRYYFASLLQDNTHPPPSVYSSLQIAVVHTLEGLLTLGSYFYVSSLWKVEVMTEHWRTSSTVLCLPRSRCPHVCFQSRIAHPSVVLLHQTRAAMTKCVSNRFVLFALLFTVMPLDIFTCVNHCLLTFVTQSGRIHIYCSSILHHPCSVRCFCFC